MYCPKCGTQNDENNYQCVQCGEVLHAAPQTNVVVQTTDSSVEAIIPYRNAAALLAYYCGIFSLIPCLGLVLGLVAIVAGLLGLRRAREHPEAKGQIHAWVGIILGGLVVLGHIAGIIAIAVSAGP